jgi:hypothetical protein
MAIRLVHASDDIACSRIQLRHDVVAKDQIPSVIRTFEDGV